MVVYVDCGNVFFKTASTAYAYLRGYGNTCNAWSLTCLQFVGNCVALSLFPISQCDTYEDTGTKHVGCSITILSGPSFRFLSVAIRQCVIESPLMPCRYRSVFITSWR